MYTAKSFLIFSSPTFQSAPRNVPHASAPSTAEQDAAIDTKAMQILDETMPMLFVFGYISSPWQFCPSLRCLLETLECCCRFC
mmetsp:Transcript_5635/g.14094  ORF Transcript_5635/g.14094 Transcript_5635/m.14094 type:complete len:83 (+) Transcript_5635:129-377(+)